MIGARKGADKHATGSFGGASPRSRRLSFLAGLSAVAICALAALSTLPLWQGCIISCKFETTQWRYDLPNGYRIHGNIYYDGHYGAALVRPDGETALMAVVPFDVCAFCTDGRYIGLRHKRMSAWVGESYFLLDSVSGEWTLESASQEDYAAACARTGAQMGGTDAQPRFWNLYVYDADAHILYWYEDGAY